MAHSFIGTVRYAVCALDSQKVPQREPIQGMDTLFAAGTAESAGFFCTTGKARGQQTRYECTRIKLDRFMVRLSNTSFAA